MSYKVLARKYRPQHFRDMIGQETVLKALENALDTGRLHHAYLFTGMRGVGKTTIARIFAKCLNCERNGVSADPCGACSTCQDIEAGRYPDLIEVDAASRTRVEETRDLLENVPYAPSSGRYKVYLIDEVHMFSTHSFNALLKTLEEPPEHVKFLLATTDPQQVPVTVLSRCLQFNLRRMAPGVLRDFLARVLEEESVGSDLEALELIARASEGSVRDALSLTEQAAAHGGGEIRTVAVAEMLGKVSRSSLLELLRAVFAHDGRSVLEQAAVLDQFGPDHTDVLGQLASMIHEMAVSQWLGDQPSDDEAHPVHAALVELAATVPADELQLVWHIAVKGREQLPHAPDMREAFELCLLRMVAFAPQPPLVGAEAVAAAPSPRLEVRSGSPAVSGSVPLVSEAKVVGKAKPRPASPAAARQKRSDATPTGAEDPDQPISRNSTTKVPPQTGASTPVLPAATPSASEQRPSNQGSAVSAIEVEASGVAAGRAGSDLSWPELVSSLNLAGLPMQLARNAEFAGRDGAILRLQLASAMSHFNVPKHVSQLEQALSAQLGESVTLKITLSDDTSESPAAIQQRQEAAELDAARRAIDDDPLVQQMLDGIEGEIRPDSIRPRRADKP